MKYQYYCQNCLQVKETQIEDNLMSFTCTGCACTIRIKNEHGLSREFQSILNKGVPSDKNGQPLKAGDIVKIDFEEAYSIGVVEWKFDKGFSVLEITYTLKKDNIARVGLSVWPIYNNQQMEIIGTIYANPELLNLDKV